jgi:hypothetical protein
MRFQMNNHGLMGSKTFEVCAMMVWLLLVDGLTQALYSSLLFYGSMAWRASIVAVCPRLDLCRSGADNLLFRPDNFLHGAACRFQKVRSP